MRHFPARSNRGLRVPTGDCAFDFKPIRLELEEFDSREIFGSFGILEFGFRATSLPASRGPRLRAASLPASPAG
eukprot:1177984-Prorocentrum_minimum.AAC.5